MADIIKNIEYYNIQDDTIFEGIIGADALNVDVSETTQDIIQGHIGVSATNVDDTLGLLAEAIELNSGGSGSTITNLSASNVTLSSGAQTALTGAGISATEADTAISSLANTAASTNSELTTLSSTVSTLEDTIAALNTDSDNIIVTITINDETEKYQSDYTFSEIVDYINEGKNIYLVNSSSDSNIFYVCPLTQYRARSNSDSLGYLAFTSTAKSISENPYTYMTFYIFPTNDETGSMAVYYTIYGNAVISYSGNLLISDSTDTQTISAPLSITGDTSFTSTVDFSEGGTLTGLSEPTNDSDAANKSYVDTAVSSITIDTTDLATIDYVDSSISTATSGLATTSYVTSATSSLASKTYVSTLLNQEVPYTIEYGTYIGSGEYGEYYPMNLDFGAEPILVMISMTGYDEMGAEIENASGMGTAAPWFSFNRVGQVTYGTSYETCKLNWYGTGIDWWYSFDNEEDTTNGAAIQLNLAGYEYSYMAVLVR